jgi:hypothetical protein
MKRSNVLSILVLVAMIAGLFGFASATPAAASGETFSTPVVSVPTFTAGVTTINVDVSINTGTSTLRGWQFNMTYNPAVIQLVSWTEDKSFFNAAAVAAGGDTFRVGGTSVPAAGTLTGAAVSSLGFTGTSGVSGSGKIANLTFKVMGAGKANLAFSGVQMLNASVVDIGSAFVQSVGAIRVGAAPSVAVQSIAFTPANGSTTPSVAVTVVNNGSAMVAGDETVVTLGMSSATPATAAFPVALLGAGATTVLTQAYTVTGSSSVLTVTDSVYGINQSQTYFAAISDVKNTNIDATFNANITLTTTGAISFNPLLLGNNQQYATMNVLSNAQTWTVSASANNNGNGWNLSEWNGTAFVAAGRKLSDPLRVSAFRGVVAAGSLAGVNGTLINGLVAGQSLDAGENFNVTYEQFLHNADAVLTAPNTYHGVITYTAAVSF